MIETDALFRETTARICGPMPLSQALADTCAYLRQFLPLDVMLVSHYDAAEAAVRVLASADTQHGAEAGEDDEPLFTLDACTLADLSRTGMWVDAAHPLQVRNQAADDPAYRAARQRFSAYGLSRFSLLLLYLDLGADGGGALWVAARGLATYRAEHGVLLQSLGVPFAMAVRHGCRCLETTRLRRCLLAEDLAATREGEVPDICRIIGAELGLREVMKLVRQVAPLDAPVLLQGETGTGKEVIAQAIRMASSRRQYPLVRLQCGAVPDTLLDSELFGHEKGAFTDAVQAKAGRFECADKGTLFLDEIGELSLEAQVKLLRVLQDGTFERLGGTRTYRVDVRVIAATHRDLRRLVAAGQFREDLWFRLHVFPIELPPLRRRKADIPALTRHFIDTKTREMGWRRRPRLAPGAMEQLLDYQWPGNVRELRNVIERALILCRGDELRFPDLGDAARQPPAAGGEGGPERVMASLDEVIIRHIQQALVRSQGRIQGPGGAAELLDVNPSTLRARLRKLDIPFGHGAPW